MKMSPAEAIAAATINGAWALRLQERKGSIEPGKDADLAVFDVETIGKSRTGLHRTDAPSPFSTARSRLTVARLPPAKGSAHLIF